MNKKRKKPLPMRGTDDNAAGRHTSGKSQATTVVKVKKSKLKGIGSDLFKLRSN